MATKQSWLFASQINRVLLRHVSLFAILPASVTLGLIMSFLLLAVLASGLACILTLIVPFIVLSAAICFVIRNIVALALGSMLSRMGSATALQGTLQSVSRGIVGSASQDAG